MVYFPQGQPPQMPQQQAAPVLRPQDSIQQQMNQLDGPSVVGLGAVNPYSMQPPPPPSSMASQAPASQPIATPGAAATLAAAGGVPGVQVPGSSTGANSYSTATQQASDAAADDKRQKLFGGLAQSLMGDAKQELANAQQAGMSAYNTIFSVSHGTPSTAPQIPMAQNQGVSSTVGQQTVPMVQMSDKNQKTKIKSGRNAVYDFLNAVYREKNGR